MICPHCGIGTSPTLIPHQLGWDDEFLLVAASGNCTECKHMIVMGRLVLHPNTTESFISSEFILYPPGPHPRRIPEEVTGDYAQDFREASIVLQFSPKASAALSRRLVQHVIREKAGIRKGNLNDEIDELIAQDKLPADLANDLDMIRRVGNFAAHPIKSTSTGEVVGVEPGEAEALLDLLEELLDYYFVRPARRAAKRDQLNAKLAEAGKPPLKTVEPPAHD